MLQIEKENARLPTVLQTKKSLVTCKNLPLSSTANI